VSRVTTGSTLAAVASTLSGAVRDATPRSPTPATSSVSTASGCEGLESRRTKARHTAGQRVLDATGNLKATQKLLGHASIATTGDAYADWDIDQLAETMRLVLEGVSDRKLG
jgi:hypothetical protein